MIPVTETPDSDPQILASARRVLAARGFRLQESRLPEPADAPWLLAENEYFLIAVVAGRTVDDIRVFEGYVAAALNELLANSAVGSKRWDSYVVLLASADADQRGRPSVLELEYNTRSLRRLVSLGVTEASVEEALSPFFSLPDPPAGGLPPAYDELVEQLVVHGVDAERAQSAVASYRHSGGLDDI